MDARTANLLKRLGAVFVAAIGLQWAAGSALAQAPAQRTMTWDQSRSVYNRQIHTPEPAENVNWEARVTALLKEEPGDVVITAVGDMIFNQQISNLPEPYHKQLFRIMQEADVAYGNLEFSLNDHPELQRPFYNFRAPIEFRWEVAAIGINLVSMANNHALDFGQEGRNPRRQCAQPDHYP